MRQVHPYRDKILKLAETFSYSLVAQKMGGDVTRSVVAGLVARARKAGANIPASTKISAVRRVTAMAAKKARLGLEEPAAIGTYGDKGCKWPHGEPAALKSCGHPRFADKPYCEHHASRAYAKPNNAAA